MYRGTEHGNVPVSSFGDVDCLPLHASDGSDASIPEASFVVPAGQREQNLDLEFYNVYLSKFGG